MRPSPADTAQGSVAVDSRSPRCYSGALIGGMLVLKVDNFAPLALAAGLLAIVSFFTYRASRPTPAWAEG